MPFTNTDGSPLEAIELSQVVDAHGQFGKDFRLTRGFVYTQSLGFPVQVRGRKVPPVIPVTASEGQERTDLASVPWPFWSLISPHGRQSAPALLHDQECHRVNQMPGTAGKAELVREQLDERAWIDLMFQRALREQRVPRLRARLMWSFVSVQSYFGRATLRGLLIIALALLGAASFHAGVVILIRVLSSPEDRWADMGGWWALLVCAPALVMILAHRIPRLMGTLLPVAVVLGPVMALMFVAVGMMRLVEFIGSWWDPQRDPFIPPTLDG